MDVAICTSEWKKSQRKKKKFLSYRNIGKLFRYIFLGIDISKRMNIKSCLNYITALITCEHFFSGRESWETKSDVIALVLERGENSRTLFRVCRSWQCMYVLTILTMVERDVGGNDSNGRSITSQMNDGCSRHCDREPIMLRTTETIDLDPRSIFTLQNDAPWNQRSRRLNFRIPSFATPRFLATQTWIILNWAVLNCKTTT